MSDDTIHIWIYASEFTVKMFMILIAAYIFMNISLLLSGRRSCHFRCPRVCLCHWKWLFREYIWSWWWYVVVLMSDDMLHISEYTYLNTLWKCSWYWYQHMFSFVYCCLVGALYILGISGEVSVSVTRSNFKENNAGTNGGKFIWRLWTHVKRPFVRTGKW